MIIYTRDLDFNKVCTIVNSHGNLVRYVENLVPTWARCFPHIVDNQRYYVAMQLRSILQVPFKVRKAYVEELCNGLSLRGLTTVCITVSEVLAVCNMDSLRVMVGEYCE